MTDIWQSKSYVRVRKLNGPSRVFVLRQQWADTVEKVGLGDGMAFAFEFGRSVEWSDRRPRRGRGSGCAGCGGERISELGELPQILNRGGEEKFVAGAIGAAQP